MPFDPGPTIPPMDENCKVCTGRALGPMCAYHKDEHWKANLDPNRNAPSIDPYTQGHIDAIKIYEVWIDPHSVNVNSGSIQGIEIGNYGLPILGVDTSKDELLSIIEAQRLIIEELRAPKFRPGCAGYCLTHENDWIPLP